MQALPSADRALLTKMFGRLGSDQPGEILAAVHLINQFIQRRKVTWDDVINPPPQKPEVCSPPPRQEEKQEPPTDWFADLFLAQRNSDLCSDWERNFLASISSARRLSQKQQTCLANIAHKLRAKGFT